MLGIWSDVTVLFLIYSVYAASLTVIIGYAGILAVAPTAFGAIGGYLTAWLAVNEGINSYLALLIAVAVVTLLGAALSVVVLRLAPVFVILITLALGTIVVGTLPKIDALGGPYGISGVPAPSFLGLDFSNPIAFVVPAAILAIVAYVITRIIGDSTLGLVLRALRQEETAVEACGINPTPPKVLAFAVSAGLGAAAGAATTIYNGVVTPGGFGFATGMMIVAVAVIGGIARPIGAVLGAAIIQVVPQILEQLLRLDPSRAFLIQQAVFGVVLIVVMLLRPSGIFLEKPSRFVRSFLRRAGVGAAHPEAPTLHDDAHSQKSVVLAADRLSKSFGGIIATNGFSFELGKGQIVGLIGPNGAGKTTLFNLLTGALKKDAGSVSLLGTDITRAPMHAIAARGMSRSFQDVRLWHELTTLENVFVAAFGSLRAKKAPLARLRGRRDLVARALETATRSLERVGLGAKSGTLAGDLTHGEQKLVAFARLLAADAEVLLLDEPTAGVGPDVSRQLLELVKQLGSEGRSILLVEHNLDVMREVAEWCYFMEQGAVVAEGEYADLSKDPQLVASYFGSAPDKPKAKRAEVNRG